MTDIIIYTTEEKLNHKKGLQKGEEAFEEFYWTFKSLPKKLEIGDKVYFAIKGFIRGYFIVNDINKSPLYFADVPENNIIWNKNSWVELKEKIPTKSFQGFKYVDKVEELNEK